MVSSDQHAIYYHHPLTKGRGQFRVLILHSTAENPHDHRIHGSLLVSTLNREKNKFETLSYVWGSPDLPKTVALINEVPMNITTNLAAFLVYLRRAQEPVRIWADSICINQTNNDEKSDQVALMAEIYKSCSKVNVWLPSPMEINDWQSHDRTVLRLGAFLSFIAMDHVDDIPGYTHNQQTNRFSFKETEEFRISWDGFVLLAESVWWTRAWTAQETFLPPQVIFHHNAAEPCDMDLVLRAMECNAERYRRFPPCSLETLEGFPTQKARILKGFFNKIGLISNPRQIHARKRISDGRDCFYITVASFAERQSYQGRDRIYSLWSTAGGLYKSHKPDYSCSDGEVFTSVFQCMIRESQRHLNTIFSHGMDFRVLQGLNFGPTPNKADQKPSWVPDFSRSWDMEVVHANLNRLAISRMYQASGWSRGRAKVSGTQLHLKGFFMDTILVVGPAVAKVYDAESLKQTLSQWKLMTQAFEVHKPNVDMFRKQLAEALCGEVCQEFVPHDQQASLLRSFVLDGIWKVNIVRLLLERGFRKMALTEYYRPFRPDDYPVKEEIESLFGTGDIKCLTNVPYRNAVATSLSYRSLFITDSGRIGLGVGHARAGDQVWGMYGSRVPFVLRQLSSEADSSSYNMIGDCYLHGAMKGELVRKGVKIKLV
ncbi:heterokaryon incompatibility protein-domain-containing protein [Nemania abortiva]|nr:heterokaryon incompatibility protein-domain-containing protein [Nemania abortiva]